MDIDPEKFHRSISNELKVVQDRVRNLIVHIGEKKGGIRKPY